MEDRVITLTDGTDMGGMIIVFRTNAPIEELKELEKVSNAVYINGGAYEDVPIWAEVLKNKGYVFDYVDEHEHITALGTSSDWLEKKYSHVTEHYTIDNQPNRNKEFDTYAEEVKESNLEVAEQVTAVSSRHENNYVRRKRGR